MTGSVSPPQGIISREQGNRTKAGEGGRCVFPSFFVPSSTSWPGHLPFFWHVLLFLPSSFVLASRRRLFIFPRKKKKRIRPPSVQDRHLFPFGKKPGKANVVSLPSLKKRKRKEGNCHAVGIRRQEGGAAILLAFSSGKTFPPFFQKRKRKKRREHRNPSSRMEAFPVSGREKKRKKRKKGIQESSCLSGRTLLPALGEKAKRKGGTPFFGTVLPSCKKGNASRCGIRKRRFLSPLQFGITPLSEKRKRKNIIRTTGRRKRRKEKYRPFLAVPPQQKMLE